MLDELEHRRLRSELAGLRVQLALLRLGLIERKYSPDQSRVPAGSPEGGRWTEDGGGAAAFDDALAGAPPTLDDGVWRPATDNAALVPAAVKPPPLVDLRAEEKQGGHAFDHKHVAVPNSALAKQLEGERLDLPFETYYRKAHGSFNDIDSANAYVNDALQASPERVAAVAAGAEPEWNFLRRYGSPTGREAYRAVETDNSAILIRPTFWVFTKIKHTGTGKGFVVTTAYPTNEDK